MQAGDTVQLKSGGPVMTVKWVNGTEVYCEWFSANAIMGAPFVLAQLDKV